MVRTTGTLLGVWALHPDDEAYLSAGLMASARDAGQRVGVATATWGERGTDDSERWPPARLATCAGAS
jgi:LmbE family N-acetylglucosaminyl deacetylase